jgi:exonuclease SbcC
MLAGEGFDVQLDENFTPLIIQGETEMEYSFLSGGERTAVALAYRLALNQTINSVLSNIETKDIIILDEPTEGFSETQLDKLRYVLEELDIGQLIIVSHEQKIEGFVDNVLRLKKDGDASVLENSPSSPKNLNTPQI